jgi:flagellar motor switch protein FliG
MSAAALEIPRFEELSGPQRTAILVMYLERPTARAVLAHFDDDELQLVGEAMATIDRVPSALVEDIVSGFVKDLHEACLVPSTGSEFVMGAFPDLVPLARRPKLISGLRRKLSTRLADEVKKHPACTVAAIPRPARSPCCSWARTKRLPCSASSRTLSATTSPCGWLASSGCRATWWMRSKT